MAEPALAVEGLVAGYAEGSPVVRGASLELRRGEVLALFGPNGAGKSTLVKAVAGVAPVFAGRVLRGGRDLAGLPAHRVARAGVGTVPQVANVFAEMTVRENLELALAMRRGPGPSIGDVLEVFPDLSRLQRLPAGRLSGGQRQMAAIARALVGAPGVLMLDEPSAGLAPRVVAEVFASLRRLAAEVAILLVEQNVPAALTIADRAVLLSQGTVRLTAAARDFLADPVVRSTFLGGRP